MIGAEPQGEEVLVVAVAAEAAGVARVITAVGVVATGMSARMTRAPRKATWEVTTTSPARLHLGHTTTRTATTTLQVPGSTIQIPLAAMARGTVMKVRLRVQSESFEILCATQAVVGTHQRP